MVQDQNAQAWIKAINEDGMYWKQGIDQDSKVFHLYHVKTIPCLFLLDDENRIIAKDLKGDDLQKTIGELLKKK